MVSRQQESTEYRFGPYLLIPQRQLLLRGGIPVRIGGRSFDILTLLVRRAGEDVSKSELLTFCWPSTYVHESNLKVNVASLRRTLDAGSADAYITTVSNFGYRFTAAVSREQTGGLPEQVASISSIRQPTDVIGRAAEIHQLAKLLAKTRCLSIVGPGGMGKTTIALALAHHVRSNYGHGVEFVDMSTVGDPAYAPAAIAAGVGARQHSDDALAEIVSVLQERHTLLVVDNCEHLLSSIASIANRLLNALPSLTILTTSREPLSIAYEQVHRLASLSVPQPHQSLTASEANNFGAIRLFVTRASGMANYVLSDADAPLIAAICRRLDGIPLAIELAASKTFAYGVRTLHTMLEQKLLFPKNNERTAPTRQQTMLATLDWSYRLLSQDEAALLRVTSVFSGKFQLEDAIAVAEQISFDATQTIDGLERLTSKSLVYAEHHDGFVVYRLLESTRAFASERLRETGEHDAALLIYARRVLALFERASVEADARDKGEWMSDYARRVDDGRSVMNWAFAAGGDRLLGIQLTAAVIPLWYELSALNEMRSRVETALRFAREMTNCPPELTMKLVGALASTSAFVQQLPQNTEASWRECYELGIQTRSAKYEIMGLWGLCSFLIYTGRTTEALERLKDCVSLAQAQSDSHAVDEAYRMMATAEIYLGRIAEARQRLEQLAARHRKANDPTRFARFHSERGVGVRCTLALALFVSGEPERAMLFTRAAVERAMVSGHLVSLGNALAVFAVPIAFWSGDYTAADEFLQAAEQNGRMDDTGAWREVCHFFKSALRAKRQEVGAVDELQARLGKMMVARQVLRAPIYHAMVAEALLESGMANDGMVWAEEAFQLAKAQDANWCMPEILRVKALLELRSKSSEAAEVTFRSAISEANLMGAYFFELKASLSLARHLAAMNRPHEALEVLEASCARFAPTDRFADLSMARELLAQTQSERDGRVPRSIRIGMATAQAGNANDASLNATQRLRE